MSVRKIFSWLLAFLVIIYLFPNISFSAPSEITSILQLNDRRYELGGSSYGPIYDKTLKFLPNARKNPYNNLLDACLALKNRKIDAVIWSEPEALAAMKNGLDGLRILDGTLGNPLPIAAGISEISKIPALKEKFNAFIAELKTAGTLSDMYRRWLYDPEANMDIAVPEKSNIHLTVGTTGNIMPFSFYSHNTLAGYDIELARRFAAYLGAEIEFKVYDFASILMALKSGNIDIALSNLYVTEENKKEVTFSDYMFDVNVIAIVRDNTDSPAPQKTVSQAFSAFSGKRIGAPVGTIMPDIVKKKIPDAKIVYFDVFANMIEELKLGKLDAFALDEPLILSLEKENSNFTHIDESLGDIINAFVFPKDPENNPLADELDEYIRRITSNGTLDELRSIWFGDDESRKTVIDYRNFPDTNGTIRIALDSETPTFAYIKNNMLVGYEINIILGFCREKGYRPNFQQMNFGSILSAVSSRKCDVGIGAITITEERAESVRFSEPICFLRTLLMFLKPQQQEKTKSPLLSRNPKYSTTAELDGKPIGMQPGIIDWEEWVAKNLPNSQVQYYNTYPDLVSAMKTHKIEGFLVDSPVLELMATEDNEITAINEPIGETFGYHFVFAMTKKGKALSDEMSEYIRKIKASGELDSIISKWEGADESQKIPPDFSKLPAKRGTIIFAAEGSYPPLIYYKGTKLAGIDIDIATRFSAEYGYGLDTETMFFDAMIPAINSGKVDFAGTFTPSDEHKEALYYSEAYCELTSLIACLTSEATPATEISSEKIPPANLKENAPSFWNDIVTSIQKTFIRENRWQLFLEGIMDTMIITVSSILCGILLGFAAFMFCRTGSMIANIITKVSVWLIKGTPIVVLLMILYYIIFGRVNVNGMIVAIIAFTLTFGTSVYRMLTFGTGAVDHGQTEAAYALGFTDLQTFFTVILPQAALHFMPSFKEEVTMLIKSTSVVGYIAVQDLTKMGDIVRSRTYEAFFPLIAVAVIYFILAGLLNTIVNIIQLRITPSRRKPEDILKGIDTSRRFKKS